jgi:DNA adenine methylase
VGWWQICLGRLHHGSTATGTGSGRTFVGAGSVFLNTEYEAYLLADIHPDLIDFYNLLKTAPDAVIQQARTLFCPANKQREAYFELRAAFNQCHEARERAALFLYLNRHGYNGLCRYNRRGASMSLSASTRPPTSRRGALGLRREAQRATFICECYSKTFERLEADHVVYCDPPYVPLSSSANFTT